jgi:prepilin-type N-terminal cleavage/methylation domain-containing protein
LKNFVDATRIRCYIKTSYERANVKGRFSGVEENEAIVCECYRSVGVAKGRGGFTLIELLVVVAILSLLAGLLVPVCTKATYQAKVALCMSNQRQIVSGVNFFAIDNDGRYPPSVATIGFVENWNWQEPTMMTGYLRRSPGLHRSMSAYLREYIEDASIMFCPNGPRRYKYLQQAWDAGDDWDNPETPPIPDPVIGTYCFYWNYVGFLDEGIEPFRGPWGPSGGSGYSRLLVSDYFGYDHWRSPESFGSCEKFKSAAITEGTSVSSAYWSVFAADGDLSNDRVAIKVHTGYTDGHVGSFGPTDVVPMRVALMADGTVPYPDGVGAGVFYLPGDAVR